MRNVLTVFALLLSGTGIFVSLAREELRCRVGLSSTECPPAIAQPENATPQDNAARLVNSSLLPNASARDKSDKIGVPSPETAKVVETEASQQIEENILPIETTTSSEQSAPVENSTPPLHSPLGAPIEQKAVDTAIINNPAPKKALPGADPIAPPASKNPAEDNLIQVIPAEGTAIPVAPMPQE
ncbi:MULTISPECIES: hypothetical protein [unclassified Synechocystis]|uniref:hypothetical protein n=1 Tax=unclassified Synechocystis TaxID=2640012 RepID=UPI0004142590|nr:MULTISPECIES: hypothetical protein [unclassified Synechocystis]AIE74801.1 hypothetical protein D082_22730 [Synechocystis sp. PCC 6714]MCT0253468.1 hypothetical protein [Synechocystis sp. CS-94]